MKTGISEILSDDEAVQIAPKSAPTLSTITLRFVTLLATIVVLLTWAWSR